MVTTLARAQGVTLGEIADLLGVHRNALTAKLKGRRQFKEAEIIALAEFFGVSPGHLFEDPLELLGVGVRKSGVGLLTSTKCEFPLVSGVSGGSGPTEMAA